MIDSREALERTIARFIQSSRLTPAQIRAIIEATEANLRARGV